VPLIFILLLLCGLGLLWYGRRAESRAGMPPGRPVYLDTLNLRRTEQALTDAGLGLTGRPDYVVRQGSRLIPVEFKSGQAGAAPHKSHVLQLAAYCLLVESSTGKRPPHGVLSYADRSYAVDFDRRLENELRGLLTEIRRLAGRPADRSHESPARCRSCGYREHCDQRLA